MGLRLLSDKYYVGVLLKMFLGTLLFVGGAVLAYYWQVVCFLISFIGLIILFLPIRVTIFCPHCERYLKISFFITQCPVPLTLFIGNFGFSINLKILPDGPTIAE